MNRRRSISHTGINRLGKKGPIFAAGSHVDLVFGHIFWSGSMALELCTSATVSGLVCMHVNVLALRLFIGPCRGGDGETARSRDHETELRIHLVCVFTLKHNYCTALILINFSSNLCAVESFGMKV